MEYAFFIAGLIIGTGLATVIIAFAALGEYERGYRAARKWSHR